jgi:hypothetical protein
VVVVVVGGVAEMASVAVGDVVECEKFPDAWCA